MRLGTFLLTLAAVLIVSENAQADFVGATVNSATDESFLSNGSFGWRFSLVAPIQTTQLGIWIRDGDGLQTSHQVGIYDSTQSLRGFGDDPRRYRGEYFG